MEQVEINESKNIAESELQKVFDVVALTEKQRALFVCVAAQIYTRGHIDALKSALEKTG